MTWRASCALQPLLQIALPAARALLLALLLALPVQLSPWPTCEAVSHLKASLGCFFEVGEPRSLRGFSDLGSPTKLLFRLPEPLADGA